MTTSAPQSLSDPRALTPELVWRIEDLNTRYARALDDAAYDDWPEFFTDPCLYKIWPRENMEDGLGGALLFFDSKAMLRDRVLCTKDVCIFNPHCTRHFIGRSSIDVRPGNTWYVRSNVSVMQTDAEGRGRLFAVGEYRDLVVEEKGSLRFREKIVVLDSYTLESHLAEPI
jgi:3-phenylpropionate/cinnamic acid dioxygenase small subunit